MTWLPPQPLRLSDDVARRRIIYRSASLLAPSILVIDVPAERRGASLSLGRYYPIMIETEAEEHEVEQFLRTPRATPRMPDLLDRRPSSIWTGSILVSRYDPPAAGWPWLCLARWSDDFAAAAAEHGIEMARGCYTFEMFEHASEADAHCAELIGRLGENYEISLRAVNAVTLAVEGHA